MRRFGTMLLLVLCGCGEEEEGGSCETTLFYADRDGDGFGDPTTPGEELCAADCVYTARNQLDCDDLDPDNTAQIGGACPSELVDERTRFETWVGRVDEYVVVYGDTALVDPVEAEGACRAWGGTLATFEDPVELWEVLDLVGWAPSFAGHVGIAPGEHGGWDWTEDSPLVISSIGWCGEEPPDAWSPDDRLSFVKDDQGWCVGPPDAARAAGGPPYGEGLAHFICARDRVYAENYE